MNYCGYLRILQGVFLVMLTSCSSAQINKTLGDINGALGGGELTTSEVASGLKEALVKGANHSADKASALDGFYKNAQIKIPFPPDIQKVESRLRQIGLGKQVDKFVLSLNRGAEEAAKQAAPIFITAVRSMTINDAWNILKGEDDAATQYLRRTTSDQLREKFSPVMQDALDKVNATKYYSDIITAYNKIPLVEKVDPDLNAYATDKAMDGLFTLVANEEKSIREDPVERTSELLKKVFSAQD